MRVLWTILIVFLISCSSQYEYIDRYSLITSEKITPEIDVSPPVLHSDEYEQPVPISINTAGGEDSPFIYGDKLYFFFTPDVSIPAEKQVIDGVTGIYATDLSTLSEPQRVWLQDPGKLSLDGCAFVDENKIYFCTAREGYTGLHWGTATLDEGKWSDWKVEDFNPAYEVGELHIYGDELYYHSARSGGKGGNDIWMLTRVNGEWANPVNVAAVNSKENDGYPYITPDGNEMWFTRTYLGTPAVYRAKRIDGEWQPAELIISQFAGEPTLDNEGNVYFVHHYYKDSVMLEADIYIAKRI